MRARRGGAGPRLPAAAETREEPCVLGREEQYVLGQVSGSLGAAAAPAAPLARLFSAAAPPVLVAVPGVSEPEPGSAHGWRWASGSGATNKLQYVN